MIVLGINEHRRPSVVSAQSAVEEANLRASQAAGIPIAIVPNTESARQIAAAEAKRARRCARNLKRK